jgi:cyclopropane-fatty-acyl-phospholipid synthase
VYNFGQSAADISAKQARGGRHFQVGLRIHRAAFYWKVATRADLGIADAYVDGDFTCLPDVMDFLMLLVVNRDRTRQPGQVRTKKR